MEYRGLDLTENVFILKPEQYTRHLNPIGQYVDQQAQFLSIMRNYPLDKARQWVLKNIRKDGKFPLRNPKVIYVHKDENDDRVKGETTLVHYLKDAFANDEIMAATFTTFFPHKVKLSYLSEYVDVKKPERSKLKKRQFQMKQEGNFVAMAFANNGQNNIKRNLNSISGASSLASTAIYMASMHPVLTSNCRMTSGYANANNEKLLGGNRHYHNADVTINNLVALTTNIDVENIKQILDKYNLYVPNTDELFEYILNSTRLYWRWPEKENLIKEFISKCSREQRAAIAFIYDLNALRIYNESFTREFIGGLARKCNPIEGMTIEEAQTIFNKSLEEIKLVAIQICSDEVKGLKESQYIGTETILKIAASIINIYEVFSKYKDYIQTFLRSSHLPGSLAQFPSSLRKIVLMSDTDSSIFTTKHWTNWFCENKRTKEKATPVFATMVMLSSLTLKHLLATMSGNLGVETKRIFTIGMKNEFGMPTLVNLNRTKHYIYTVDYQEGNVYKEMSLDKKGVHLRNSNSPQEIIEHAEDIMKRLFYLYNEDNKKIKVIDLLREVADVERDIYKNVREGGIKYFRRAQIKNPESYKDTPDRESPYVHYLFWNATFGKYYGEVSEPPYSAVNVKLDISSAKATEDWLAGFENQDLANAIRENLKQRGKDKVSSVSVPLELFLEKPLPKEIVDHVAIRELISNICSPYYIAFEAVGLFYLDKNNSKLISDFY